jgi:hypothetical protein
MNFEYVRQYYGVPAEMHREVVVGGKKGVITKDMGHYIGVVFYEEKSKFPLPCHPTSAVKYLDTFNNKPPKDKNHHSKQRYRDYLASDCVETFREWLGIKPKRSKY